MVCDSRTTIETKLLGRVKDQNPTGKDHSAKMTSYAFFVRDGITEKGVMPVQFMYITPTKAGGWRVKKINSSVTFNFCPFCGVRYENRLTKGGA